MAKVEKTVLPDGTEVVTVSHEDEKETKTPSKK